MKSIELQAGIERFTRPEILDKAATFKGLTLNPQSKAAYSQPFKTYKLDERLLAVLSRHNINRHPRPEHHKIFTLGDDNRVQNPAPGFLPSNYWNFELRDGAWNLQISLSVGFKIDQTKRGVALVPIASGTGASPCDPLPNFRMFKSLTDDDQDALPVARELAASDGTIVVTWTDLGLGGLRSQREIFVEFAQQNRHVIELQSNSQIFNPVPVPPSQKPGDESFIIEPAQPKIMAGWRTQLEEYQAQLKVA